MAGLPKRYALLCLVAFLIAAISWLGVSQDVQTPSSTIDPEDLQVIAEAVESNPTASDEEKELLIGMFADAVGGGTLDVALVGEMLDVVGWDTLDEGIADTIELIGGTLADYLDGVIEDPVGDLADTYNASLTPDGIVNAVTQAGASPEVVAQVQSLVASGVPPGIVLRVTKAGLRGEELDPSVLLTDLEALFEEDPNMPPGQAANAVLNKGSYKHQEQEENQNVGQDDTVNEEQEANANGSGNGKQKNSDKGNGGKKGGKGKKGEE